MKSLAQASVFSLICVIAGVIGLLVWFGWEIGTRAINALDAIGPGLFEAGALVTFGVFVFVVVGGAVALVRWMALRSRAVHPGATGLYPLQYHGGQYVNNNTEHAQALAVMHAAGRATSASVGKVLDWQPAPVPELPAPVAAEIFPQTIDVYGSEIPRDLALPVGVDGSGRAVALPMRNLGNVLVAGLPGAGKSELLASMIAGVLRQSPDGRRAQVAVIDTKLVSFGNLPPMAGLWQPPALDIGDAQALVWQVLGEVRRRYELLHNARVRSLEELQATTGETLPYVVVVVDEVADLTCDVDKKRQADFLASATEIGRKGRACGVSLVMATQRPSADTIPSTLRNLAGAAVAFRLAKADDSRLVLGSAGAESLPSLPGRCIVKHSTVTTCQAYRAGLEGGQFDRFCASLPTPSGMTGGIAVPDWPGYTGIPAESMTVPAPSGDTGGIPVFNTDDRTAYSQAQIDHIQALYGRLGSIKAVERNLYGQDGGYWFYRLQEVLA